MGKVIDHLDKYKKWYFLGIALLTIISYFIPFSYSNVSNHFSLYMFTTYLKVLFTYGFDIPVGMLIKTFVITFAIIFNIIIAILIFKDKYKYNIFLLLNVIIIIFCVFCNPDIDYPCYPFISFYLFILLFISHTLLIIICHIKNKYKVN